MAERQVHGFLYEKKCFADFPWWTSNSDKYTDKWDGYDTELQKPVSIKCIQKGASVEFGDMFRMASINEDWILQVGFWEGKKTNIVEEYTIEIDKDDWQCLISDVEVFKKTKKEMDDISNDYSDDEKWNKFRLKYKKLWGESILQPRFKRDHKKQKRIQCGITYNNLKEYFNLG
jgi:hypothetical protein